MATPDPRNLHAATRMKQGNTPDVDYTALAAELNQLASLLNDQHGSTSTRDAVQEPRAKKQSSPRSPRSPRSPKTDHLLP